jgi:hypothetical protein
MSDEEFEALNADSSLRHQSRMRLRLKTFTPTFVG